MYNIVTLLFFYILDIIAFSNEMTLPFRGGRWRTQNVKEDQDVGALVKIVNFDTNVICGGTLARAVPRTEIKFIDAR